MLAGAGAHDGAHARVHGGVARDAVAARNGDGIDTTAAAPRADKLTARRCRARRCDEARAGGRKVAKAAANAHEAREKRVAPAGRRQAVWSERSTKGLTTWSRGVSALLARGARLLRPKLCSPLTGDWAVAVCARARCTAAGGDRARARSTLDGCRRKEAATARRAGSTGSVADALLRPRRQRLAPPPPSGPAARSPRSRRVLRLLKPKVGVDAAAAWFCDVRPKRREALAVRGARITRRRLSDAAVAAARAAPASPRRCSCSEEPGSRRRTRRRPAMWRTSAGRRGSRPPAHSPVVAPALLHGAGDKMRANSVTTARHHGYGGAPLSPQLRPAAAVARRSAELGDQGLGAQPSS